MPRPLLFFVALLSAVFGAWFFQSQPRHNTHVVDASAVIATDLQGEALDFSAATGKPKLVNFWASWCKPCVVELPLLESFAEQYRGKIDVIAVAIDTQKHVEDFLQQHPLELEVAIATADGNTVMAEWGNDKSLLPFSALLDENGELIDTHLGAFTIESLKKFVKP